MLFGLRSLGMPAPAEFFNFHKVDNAYLSPHNFYSFSQSVGKPRGQGERVTIPSTGPKFFC